MMAQNRLVLNPYAPFAIIGYARIVHLPNNRKEAKVSKDRADTLLRRRLCNLLNFIWCVPECCECPSSLSEVL